jgi:PIN domain nuclease of toxin-antitoxin system
VILLDTHVVIWLAQFPHLLSAPAKHAIQASRREDGLAIADKTLWELAMMLERGRITSGSDQRAFLDSVEQQFLVLPITAPIALRAVQFSGAFPRDPTDRLIAATADIHHVPLVTKDGPIRLSKEVRCIW